MRSFHVFSILDRCCAGRKHSGSGWERLTSDLADIHSWVSFLDFLTVKDLLSKGAFGELSEFDVRPFLPPPSPDWTPDLVVFMGLFQSHFDRFKNALNTGARAWKDAPSPGTGHEYDLGAHLVDQAVDLFGKPESVFGVVRNARAIGHKDVADNFVIHRAFFPCLLIQLCSKG